MTRKQFRIAAATVGLTGGLAFYATGVFSEWGMTKLAIDLFAAVVSLVTAWGMSWLAKTQPSDPVVAASNRIIIPASLSFGLGIAIGNHFQLALA